MDVVTLGAALKGAKAYTDATISPLLGGVHYRGSVSYFNNLPSNPSEGDAYTVKYTGTSGTASDGAEYVWALDNDDNTYKWISFASDSYTKAEVDSALSGKQDTIDSTHKLNADNVDDTNSTNKFATAAELTQIETNKTNILLKANTSDVNATTDNLQAQIDNIVGGSTEDSEVINARVSSDGVTYATLNGRITAIETDLSILPNAIDSIPITVELGGLGTDGSLRDDFTNRARAGFLPCNPALKIRFAPNTKHRIAYYQDNRIAKFRSMTAWSDTLTDTIDIPSGETYAAIYILVGYTDDREITSDNIPNVWFECEKSNINEAVHVNGYYCAQDMPTMGKNDNFATTGFIPIEPNATYRFSTIRVITTYDSTLTPVRYMGFSSITDNSITFSPTEKYVMFSWRLSDATSVYFAKSNEYVGGAYIKDLVPISLNGKKLSLLGDSISAFAGTIPSGNDAYYTGSNSGVENKTQMWWYVLCQKTGMIPLVINGYSGSGITQLTDTAHLSKVPMSDTTRDEALHSGITNPDIILIAGGLNDYAYAEQSSQMPSNWDGTTAPVKGNSFDETYACMIKEIQTTYPTAIVVCLSTWFSMRGTDNGYTLTNGEGLTQADYDNAIEKVAKIMRVPYINAEMCGFSRSNYYPTYAEDSSTVPTHPNAAGHKVMGEYLANVIPSIVKAFVK